MAHLADDPGLIDAFERDADIHTATAARVFGVAEDGVTSEQRRFAKVVNYGLAYGMEAYGLAQRAEIDVDEAKDILDAYFEGFPRIRAFMDNVVRRPATRATRRPCSAGVGCCPSSRPTTSVSARWASAWPRTPRCRARPPTSSRWRLSGSTSSCGETTSAAVSRRRSTTR